MHILGGWPTEQRTVVAQHQYFLVEPTYVWMYILRSIIYPSIRRYGHQEQSLNLSGRIRVTRHNPLICHLLLLYTFTLIMLSSVPSWNINAHHSSSAYNTYTVPVSEPDILFSVLGKILVPDGNNSNIHPFFFRVATKLYDPSFNFLSFFLLLLAAPACSRH